MSGGNFHGMPLAIALDTLSIALSHLAGIAERRIFWLLAATDGENPGQRLSQSEAGTAQRTHDRAVHGGGVLQRTADARDAGIGRQHPDVSAGIEDYNSMGATAAHQVATAVRRAREVVAIELLVMSEALEYHRPLRSGDRVEALHERVRSVVPRLVADRPPAPDIAALEAVIAAGIDA